MASLRSIANKLQTALALRGQQYSINQTQFWSENSERMVTKFVLREMTIDKNGKRKSVTVLETYQLIDIVKFFAGKLENGGEA